MKEKNKQQGFIQIPLLIAIIAGVLVLGGAGYIGVKEYQSYQIAQQKELEGAKKDIENLKNQITESSGENFQPDTSQIVKPSNSLPSFSEFKEQFTQTQSPKTTPSSPTRYISNSTTLYSLTINKPGSSSLKYIKLLDKGTRVTLMNEVYESWSKISVDNQEGWVFSSDLVSNESSVSKSDIIKKWRPIVAYVECDFRDLNTNQLYSQVRGSGVVMGPDAPITVITNRHIIVDSHGYQPYICRIKLPNDSNTFIGQKFTGGGSIDIGLIDINNPDEYIKNLTSISTSPLNYCRQKPSLGDEVIILGYPSIGSQTDITATEGIISGYDGNYFITSAKVEQGNSGGAAVSIKGDCYLGIPSFAKAGDIESLSRILDINVALGSQ